MSDDIWKIEIFDESKVDSIITELVSGDKKLYDKVDEMLVTYRNCKGFRLDVIKIQ